MDPLSVAASVIALVEVGQRAIKIIGHVRKHISPTDEIDALRADIEHLDFILTATTSTLQGMRPEYASRITAIIKECQRVMGELESIMEGCGMAIHKAPIGKFRMHIIRVHWMSRISKVRSLKTRLRENLFALLLCLTVTKSQPIDIKEVPRLLTREYYASEAARSNISMIQSPATRARQDISMTTSPLAPYQGFEITTCTGSTPGPSNPFIRVPLSEFTVPLSMGRDVHLVDREKNGIEPLCLLKPNKPEPSMQLVEASASTTSFDRRCPRSCMCACHRQAVGCLRIFSKSLGYFHLSRAGNILNPGTCSVATCKIKSITRFYMVYYGPRSWLSLSFALSIVNSGRVHVSLSLPRILPPDHPLFVAVRAGDCNSMRELFAAGQASPADIAAPYGMTALDLAACYGHSEASRLLIDHGAALFTSPLSYWRMSDLFDHFANMSRIAFSISAADLQFDMMGIFSSGWLLKSLELYNTKARREELRFSELHERVLGFSSDLRGIASNCYSRDLVNEGDSCSRTPLYWAATLGKLETVQKLLLLGADPAISDVHGTTALHRAASVGSVQCIDMLLAAGAEMEAKDRFGVTPLSYASSVGAVEAVEALLHHGSDIDAPGYLGETAIMWANHSRQAHMVKLLAMRGASLHHKDEWGYNPVLDAVLSDSHNALSFLLDREWDRTAALFDGKNVLHIAALNSDLHTIELLLKTDLHGADSQALDDAGHTPQEYMRMRPDVESLLEPFCALLLHADSNPKSRPKYHVDDAFNANDTKCRLVEDLVDCQDIFFDCLSFE